VKKLRLSWQLLRQGEKGMPVYWDSATQGSGENVPYLSGSVEKTMGTLLSWEQEFRDCLKVFVMGGNQTQWGPSGDSKNTFVFQTLLQFEL